MAPIGIPTSETRVIPRVWWTPAGIVDRITGSAPVCPEPEYRTHEQVCVRCRKPLVCGCPHARPL